MNEFLNIIKQTLSKRKFKFVFGFIIVIILSIIFFNLYFAYIIEQKIPILTYHNIYPDEIYNKIEPGFFDTKLSTFTMQMNFLKEKGFKTLTLKEYECWKKGKCKQPRRSVLITFDDGWSSIYKYAAPVMKKNNQKGVSFVLYNNVVNSGGIDDLDSFLTLEVIEKSKEEYPNIEYASHSYNMHNHDMHGKRTLEEMQNDIDNVKKYNNTQYYAYPNGYSNPEYEKILKDNGFLLAFGFGPYSNSSRKDNDYHVNRMAAGDALPEWKFKLKMIYRY